MTAEEDETFREEMILDIQGKPMEEVELTVQVDKEAVEEEVVEDVHISEVVIDKEEVESEETHREELILDISGQPQEEIEIDIPAPEATETTETVEETVTSQVEVEFEEEVEEEETHRQELTIELAGKPKVPEKVQMTIQMPQQQPEEEILIEQQEEEKKSESPEKQPSPEQEEFEEAPEGKAPEFIFNLTSIKVMDGEEVKFRCEVSGIPMPEITWYHDEMVIEENQDFSMTYDRETGICTLLIVEVFPQDRGEYRCVAVNEFGEAISRAILEVECKCY